MKIESKPATGNAVGFGGAWWFLAVVTPRIFSLMLHSRPQYCQRLKMVSFMTRCKEDIPVWAVQLHLSTSFQLGPPHEKPHRWKTTQVPSLWQGFPDSHIAEEPPQHSHRYSWFCMHCVYRVCSAISINGLKVDLSCFPAFSYGTS